MDIQVRVLSRQQLSRRKVMPKYKCTIKGLSWIIEASSLEQAVVTASEIEAQQSIFDLVEKYKIILFYDELEIPL